MFDIKQAEQVAQTVLFYERGQGFATSYNEGAAQLALASTEVLTTGVPSDDLSWSLNLKLGCMPDHSQWCNYSEHHPLNYAAAFLDHADLSERFVARVRRDLQQSSDSAYTSSNSRSNIKGLPGPRDLSQRLDIISPVLFHPSHAAWYQPKALVRMAGDTLTTRSGIGAWLRELGTALELGGQSPTILKEIATRTVLKELKKKATLNTDFVALAKAISIADQEPIEKDLLATPGIYQVLCVTLPNPSPETMKKGLRALAGSRRMDMLKYFGRAPTIDELLGANVKGAATVWRLMPWSLLEPVVQEHGTKLRAALLKRNEITTKVEELKQVLVDHEKRAKLDTDVEEEPDEADTGLHRNRPIPFYKFQHGVVDRFFAANRLRTILNESYSSVMARFILFRHLSFRTDLGQYTDHLLTDAARHALASYEPPLRPGNRRKENTEPTYYNEVL
jgi:hypothetical protein